MIDHLLIRFYKVLAFACMLGVLFFYDLGEIFYRKTLPAAEEELMDMELSEVLMALMCIIGMVTTAALLAIWTWPLIDTFFTSLGVYK